MTPLQLKTRCLVLLVALCACKPRAESFRYHLSPPDGLTATELFFQGIGAELKPGHTVELAENGKVFEVMVDEINRAQSSVSLVTYIWKKGVASDRIIAAITGRRAAAHIACNILVDAFGSPDWADDLQPLKAAGCDVRVFRSLPGVDALARNHRKLLIVDGAVAVAGGFGVRDNWLGDGLSSEHWRDSNIKIAGPAVRQMQQAFTGNWLEAGGPPLPPAAFPQIEPAGDVVAAFVPSVGAPVGTIADRLTQLSVLLAKKRVWITNAYFVPNGSIYELLREKAKAGVDVRLITAGSKSDSKPSFAIQQTEYGALRADGVKIWEYQPAMIHCKTMLIDDDLVVVGSINLDPLSLNKLDEGAVVAQSKALAAELEHNFVADVEQSKAIP